MSEYTNPNLNQAELFEEIIRMKTDIQILAGNVQNDFGFMIERGDVTPADIKNSIPAMEEQFDSFVERVKSMKLKVRAVMEHYVNLENGEVQNEKGI